jgi:hypothetical protein
MTVQGGAEGLGGGAFLWGQGPTQFSFHQRQGIFQRESAQCHSASFSPKAALRRGQEEGATWCGVHQRLDLIPCQFYVVQQDKGLLALQGMSGLGIGRLEWNVALVESVEEGLEQVGYGLVAG